MQKRGMVLFGLVLLFSVGFAVAAIEADSVEGVATSISNSADEGGEIVSSDVLDDERFMTNYSGTCGDFDCDELENSEKKLEVEFEGEDVEIGGAGISPDSSFYFLDKMFDGFSSDLELREERVAEIKAMVEKGDLDAAREALRRYKENADEIKDELNPDEAEVAKRSSLAIRKAMGDIEDKLSKDEKVEFYDDVVGREHGIVTAVEISGKIKELCQTLSELDPNEYSRMCRSDDDSPKWMRDLDKDLSDEQRGEAKKFGQIMQDCFKSSGQDCRCDEIPFSDFVDACSEAAPLATACDIKGDEEACEKLDALKMPELPPHLQEVFDDLEDGMQESKYDMHMPRECVEAGVTDPKECGRIMIETNAPKECKQALLDSDCERESECRMICDKIMMKLHAPECVEQGIEDPRDCAGLMKGPEGPGEGPGMRRGPMINFDCKEIDDPMKRLDCFDKASTQAKGFDGFGDDYVGNCMTESDWKAKKDECRSKYGEHAGDEPVMGDSGDGYECVVDAKCIDFLQGKMGFDDVKEMERKCADDCSSKGAAWDFSYGRCVCKSGDSEMRDDRFVEEQRIDGGSYEGGASCDDCASKCPGASGTGCSDRGCECYYDEPEGETERVDEPVNVVNEPTGDDFVDEPMGEVFNEPVDGPSEPEPSSEPSDGGVDGGITGNVFLDYYYD